MKCKVITDIAKIKDNVYYFKLNGVSYIVTFSEKNSFRCDNCKLRTGLDSFMNNCFVKKSGSVHYYLCEMISNSLRYYISSMIKESLISISKLRNGR